MNSTSKSYVFVLMGVSGSGKSFFARTLSHKLSIAFLDGDFLHPRSNIKKMNSGYPLDDNDRAPWLNAINDAIFAMKSTNAISVIVCSALKKRYRDRLREGNQNLSFLYLKGDMDLIESWMKERKGHFFTSQMLASQFEALEEPSDDELDICSINIDRSLDQVISDIINRIHVVTTTTIEHT